MKKDTLNLGSLALIQVSNAILPLFIFPFTLKSVGTELYSKIAVSESVALIALTLVLYSFEINGVSEIVGSRIKSDSEKISHIFSAIFFARLCILFICVSMLLLIGPFIDSQFFLLLLCWMLFPLSHIFQSAYLFLGLERNSPLAIFTIISRILCVALVVSQVKGPGDYYLVPLIIGSCYTFGGVLAFSYALIKFKIRLRIVSVSELKAFFYRGKEIFYGNVSVLFFKDLNVIILSILTSDDVAISTYSIAEKLIKGLQATVRPLNKLFFPKVIYLTREIQLPGKYAFRIISKLTAPQLILFTIGVGLLIIGYTNFGRNLSFIIEYPNKGRIEILFLFMVVAVFFGIGNFMFGTAGLNNLNMRKYYAKSLFIVGILSLFFSMLLVLLFDDFGAAMSFVSGEILLFIFVIRKYFKSAKGDAALSKN